MNSAPLSELIPGSKLDRDWFDGQIPENIEVGPECMVDSSAVFENFRSTQSPGLSLGRRVTLWRAQLATETKGVIEIGDYSYLANASIICAERIVVGQHCYLANGVTIADSDFHPLETLQRLKDAVAISPRGDRSNRPTFESEPVIIGNNVWVGYNATILKGVNIGDDAIIQPGSVVLSNVPAGKCVSGNPARISA